MKDANVVTAKQLARILGVAASYITQLKGEGRLVRADDGRHFLLAESRKLIADTSDPTKSGVAARHAAARGAAVDLDSDDEDEALELPAAAQDDPLAKRRALAQAQAEEAKARKLLRDEAIELGQLLQADEVRAAVADAATGLRADLENLPSILSAQLAAEPDEDRVRVILRDAIEHHLRELARKFGSVGKEAGA